MINDVCIIRCYPCGESKSIFRPLNLNKYLCIYCSNYFLNGPVAQLDKASVYGTEEYRFESYRVRQSFIKILCQKDTIVYEVYSFLNLYS